MAEYKGDSVVVEFNSIDISGQLTRARIAEEGAEPPDIDVTHKGDAVQVVLEGLPAPKKTNVEVEMWDESGDASNLMDFAIQSKDTLIVYPEGKVHTKPKLTVSNARMINRNQEIPYDGAVSLSASFHAKNSITRATYSTAA